MQATVTIKGKENGLEIVLSEKATYPMLREELLDKLKKNEDFFKNSHTKVVIRGKSLSLAQRKEMKRVFAMDYGINDVMFGDEADILRGVGRSLESAAKLPARVPRTEPRQQATRAQEQPKRQSETAMSPYITADSVFINGTVRSGQRVESENDVVIIGDVNPGAEVIAGGNIAVFGTLRGLAHAGCAGRKDVCVAAIHMCPKQLRISGRVVTFPKSEEAPEPEIAELEDGKVVIRPISAR